MMFSKINVIDIIKDHNQSLQNFSTNSQSLTDRGVFYLLPSVVALLLACKFTITDAVASTSATVMSIFAALLFNLLLLCIDFRRKINDDKDTLKLDPEQIKNCLQVLRELLANVSFAILLAVSNLIFTIVWTISQQSIPACAKTILSFLCYVTFIIFLLTLLMSLKRTYTIAGVLVFSKEILPQDRNSSLE